MARERLVEQAVELLLERIVRGEWAVGSALPAQPVLATELEVSRLTVREAVETLRSRGIVDVVHGSGTYITDPERWRDVDAVSRLVGRADGSRVSLQMIEVRRMIEVGAAEVCARRRTEDDLAALESLLEAMREADAEGDLEGFVTADMGFHDVILRGCHNPFLSVVYDPLVRVLRSTRAQTSAVPQIRAHALDHHAAVLAAVRSGDGEATRAAMAAHMDQTQDDLRTYVLDPR